VFGSNVQNRVIVSIFYLVMVDKTWSNIKRLFYPYYVLLLNLHIKKKIKSTRVDLRDWL
jgi:hypothetical protein